MYKYTLFGSVVGNILAMLSNIFNLIINNQNFISLPNEFDRNKIFFEYLKNLNVKKRWEAQRFCDYVFTFRTHVGRFYQLSSEDRKQAAHHQAACILARSRAISDETFSISRPARKIFEIFGPKSHAISRGAAC